MFPSMVLPPCMEIGCNGNVFWDTTNFSKNKIIFPLYLAGGLMWGSVMVYKCERWNASFNANDGKAQLVLEDHVACAYPVEPQYALANYRFHLSIHVTEDLESTMLTNGSGDSFSKKGHHLQCNSCMHSFKCTLDKSMCFKSYIFTAEGWQSRQMDFII